MHIIKQISLTLAMQSVLPSSFHDSTAFMAVATVTWRAVLDTAGESQRLAGETLTPEGLLASLTSDPPGIELRDALETIHELGSEAGRDILQQAAADAQVALGVIDEVPTRELVAQLWIQSRTTDAMATLLTRARVNSPALAQERQCREFAGKRTTVDAIDNEQLATAVKSWCAANAENADVFVSAYQRGDEWWYEILRGDPLKRVVEMRNSRPTILDYRPASSDLLRYDPKTGRHALAASIADVSPGRRFHPEQRPGLLCEREHLHLAATPGARSGGVRVSSTGDLAGRCRGIALATRRSRKTVAARPGLLGSSRGVWHSDGRGNAD